MSKILKNITSSDIRIQDLGILIPASGSYTVYPTEYGLLAASTNITSYVNNGSIVVNDGTSDLPPTDSIQFMDVSVSAKGARFSNVTNGFASTNVQSAIEEVYSYSFLSGVDHIQSNEIYIIPERKQSVIFDSLLLNGILIIKGKLFLRR
jgi:hypothetical protein